MEIFRAAGRYQYVLRSGIVGGERTEEHWFFNLQRVLKFVLLIIAGLSSRVPSAPKGVPRVEGKEQEANYNGRQ